MSARVSRLLRRRVPKLASFVYRFVKQPSNLTASVAFILRGPRHWTVGRRISFIGRTLKISYHVDCAHTEGEILAFVEAVARLPQSTDGCIVEAGCYQGGGTAKLSWLAALTGRRLKVFDSFRGLPPNAEAHGRDIFGKEVIPFTEHAYWGSLETVKRHVVRFGRPDVCEFVEGWFDETLPQLTEPVAAAYLDVDLVSSTKTCLKYIYPRVSKGGILASQDGHLPLVLGVFTDEQFWRNEVGSRPPAIEGLGTSKLIRMWKPEGAAVHAG